MIKEIEIRHFYSIFARGLSSGGTFPFLFTTSERKRFLFMIKCNKENCNILNIDRFFRCNT